MYPQMQVSTNALKLRHKFNQMFQKHYSAQKVMKGSHLKLHFRNCLAKLAGYIHYTRYIKNLPPDADDICSSHRR